MRSTHGAKLGPYLKQSLLLKIFCIPLHRGDYGRSLTPFKIFYYPIYYAPWEDSSSHAYPPYSYSWRSCQPLSLLLALFCVQFSTFYFSRLLMSLALVICSAQSTLFLILSFLCARNTYGWHSAIMKPNYLISQSLLGGVLKFETSLPIYVVVIYSMMAVAVTVFHFVIFKLNSFCTKYEIYLSTFPLSGIPIFQHEGGEKQSNFVAL